MSIGNYGFKLPSGRLLMTLQYQDMDPDRWGKHLAAEAVRSRYNASDLLDGAELVTHCQPFGSECPAGCRFVGRGFDMSPHFGPDGYAVSESLLRCPGFHIQFHFVAGNNEVDHLGWEGITLDMTKEDLVYAPSFGTLAYRAEVALPCDDPSYQYIWDLGDNLFLVYEGSDLKNTYSLNHPASLSQLTGWCKTPTYGTV